MLGQDQLDEFAMGSSNETSYFGPVINPWRARGRNDDLVPGGPRAARRPRWPRGWRLRDGTDTGGSIRQPAAFTGLVGLKPTYGRCSRWGVVAYASSLDQAGPMTRTVRDAAIMLHAMASHDPKDLDERRCSGARLRSGAGAGVRGLRVGIPKEYRVEGMPPEIDHLWRQGVDWLQGARRRDHRCQPAAHEICFAGLLHRGARGGLIQSRAL
jgi:aspartyl-tRNA(Asn)/glutamyl-tRNA(Gln) amidotransferase subunit A